VDAHLHKVCPATEGTYSDAFYSRLHLVVTALDNVEARRYVDRSAEACRHDDVHIHFADVSMVKGHGVNWKGKPSTLL
jgi:molybdopterin/thiamine biosynthesis adenylyltransferase